MIWKILCKDCALASREQFPGDRIPPGEKLEFTVGLSRDFLHCEGNNCNCRIGIGCVAVAMTYWNADDENDCANLGWWKRFITPAEIFEQDKALSWLFRTIREEKGQGTKVAG